MFLEESPDNFIWLGVNNRRSSGRKSWRRKIPDAAAWHRWMSPGRVHGRPTVAEILAMQGRVDVLVNNAGRHDDALLAQMTQETWSQVISLNLDSVFHGCQTVMPAMISQRSGRIINVASLSALWAPPARPTTPPPRPGWWP